MSTAELAQRDTTPPPVTGRPHESRPANRLFQVLLIGCLALALAFLVVLLTYLIIDGLPRLDSRLWIDQISLRRPQSAGAQAALLGSLWRKAFTALF